MSNLGKTESISASQNTRLSEGIPDFLNDLVRFEDALDELSGTFSTTDKAYRTLRDSPYNDKKIEVAGKLFDEINQKMTKLKAVKSLIPSTEFKKAEAFYNQLSQRYEIYTDNFKMVTSILDVEKTLDEITKQGESGAEAVLSVFYLRMQVMILRDFSKLYINGYCVDKLDELTLKIDKYLDVDKASTPEEKRKIEGRFEQLADIFAKDGMIGDIPFRAISTEKLFELATILQKKGYISEETMFELEELELAPYSEENHKRMVTRILYPYFVAQSEGTLKAILETQKSNSGKKALIEGLLAEGLLFNEFFTRSAQPMGIDQTLGKLNTNIPILNKNGLKQFLSENKGWLKQTTPVIINSGVTVAYWLANETSSKIINASFVKWLAQGSLSGLLSRAFIPFMVYYAFMNGWALGTLLEPTLGPPTERFFEWVLSPNLPPSPTTESISAFKLKVEEIEKEIKDLKRNPLKEGSDTSKLQERIERIAQTIRESENEFWGKEYGSASIIGTSEELMSREDKKGYKERLTKMKEDFGISTDIPYIWEEDLFKGDINERYEKLVNDIKNIPLRELYPDYAKEYNTLVVEGWARQYDKDWDKIAWDGKIKELKQKLDEFKEKAYSSAANMSFVS